MSTRKKTRQKPIQESTFSSQALSSFIKWPFIIIVLFVFLYLKSGYLNIPLDRDEGSLLYSGYALINGKIPYVDFYEIKPPGIFLVYGLFHLIFGYSNTLLHIGLLLLQLGIAYQLFRLSVNITKSNISGYLSAITFLIFCLSSILLSFGLMSEFFLIFFILLSFNFLFYWKQLPTTKALLFSGFCFGLAIMIRQHTIFFLLPYLILIWYVAESNFKKFFTLSRWIVVGALSIIAPLLLYIAILGAFDDMLYWIYFRPMESFVSTISYEEGRVHLISFLNVIKNRYIDIFLLPLAGLLLLFIPNLKMDFTLRVFLISLLLLSIWSVFPGNRFYGHYWINTLPAVCTLAGLVGLLTEYQNIRFMKPAILGIAMSLIMIHFYRNYNVYFVNKPMQVYQRTYGDNPNMALDKITSYLKKQLSSGEEIFVFGSEPQVYYQCRRIPKTRHSYIGTVHVPGPTNVAYQDEVITYLQTEKPDFIVHIQYAYSIFMQPQSTQKLYNWIFSYENNNYKQIAIAEEDSKGNIKYLYNKDAVSYNPTSSKYIILYKRNTQ